MHVCPPFAILYSAADDNMYAHTGVCYWVCGTSIEVYMDYMDINLKMLRYYPYHM